jgi:hypothetical protein
MEYIVFYYVHFILLCNIPYLYDIIKGEENYILGREHIFAGEGRITLSCSFFDIGSDLY